MTKEIFICVQSGHNKIVEMLLKNGANVNLKNEFEAKTALHAAAKFGKTNLFWPNLN